MNTFNKKAAPISGSPDPAFAVMNNPAHPKKAPAIVNDRNASEAHVDPARLSRHGIAADCVKRRYRSAAA